MVNPEDHTPSTEPGDVALQSYLLNGEVVWLTEQQAEMLDAQPVGRGGDLGLEQPHEGAKPITGELSADDLPQSMPFNPKDKQQAREIQGRRGLSRNQKIGLAVTGSVLGGVVAVGSAAGLAYKAYNDKMNDILEPNGDSVGAPQEPGGEEPEPSEVKLEVDEDVDMALEANYSASYEELTVPAQMTGEEVEQWNSGDYELKNQLAEKYLGPRTALALYDIYRTEATGQTPDLSYATQDPAAVDTLENAVGILPESVDEVRLVGVCPIDASDYPADSTCRPEYRAAQQEYVSDTGKAALYVNLYTDNNYPPVDPELLKGLELNMQPSVDENGVMSWVSTNN